jgi:hypothetical protein
LGDGGLNNTAVGASGSGSLAADEFDKLERQNSKDDWIPADIPPAPDPYANEPSVRTALLLTVKNSFDAGLYIDMLRKYDIAAIYELVDPITARQYYDKTAVSSSADKKGMGEPSPVGIYVQEPQLARARELVDAFDNKPIEYFAPPPRLNQVSHTNRLIYAIFMFFLIVVPLGMALFYLVYRIMISFK